MYSPTFSVQGRVRWSVPFSQHGATLHGFLSLCWLSYILYHSSPLVSVNFLSQRLGWERNRTVSWVKPLVSYDQAELWLYSHDEGAPSPWDSRGCLFHTETCLTLMTPDFCYTREQPSICQCQNKEAIFQSRYWLYSLTPREERKTLENVLAGHTCRNSKIRK